MSFISHHCGTIATCVLIVAQTTMCFANEEGLFAEKTIDSDANLNTFRQVCQSFHLQQSSFFKAWMDEDENGKPNVIYDKSNGDVSVTFWIGLEEKAWNNWKRLAQASFDQLAQSHSSRAKVFVLGGKRYLFEPAVIDSFEEWSKQYGVYPDWGVSVRIVDSDGRSIAETVMRANAPKTIYGLPEDAFEAESILADMNAQWKSSIRVTAKINSISPSVAARASDVKLTVLNPEDSKKALLQGRKPLSIVIADGVSMDFMPVPGGIWIGKTEVTQKQWTIISGDNPVARYAHDGAWGHDVFRSCVSSEYPVFFIDSESAENFVKRLNSRGAALGYRFRIPTDNEWKVAAMGNMFAGGFAVEIRRDGEDRLDSKGSRRSDMTGNRYCLEGIPSSWSSCSNNSVKHTFEPLGWIETNSDGRPHPTGQKQTNPFGLYDCLGNVSELTSDGYYHGSSFVDNPETVGYHRGKDKNDGELQGLRLVLERVQ